MNEREMQEKLILYQILQKHLETLSQNAVVLERRYEEIDAARQAMEDIAKLKEKNDILIPLGSGMFAHGRVTDPSKMLVEIGAGIFMEKESAGPLLEERKREIEKLVEEMQHEMNEVSSRLAGLAADIESASQEQRKSGKHGSPGHGKA